MNNIFFEKQITLDPVQQNLFELLSSLQKQINIFYQPTIKSILQRKLNKTPIGIYIYGPVGRGKSLLMKNFFQNIVTHKKLLVHFHEFMQEVHEKIFYIRQTKKIQSPVKEVAKQIARNYQLICLDELEINDITDAMIISKLFQEFLKHNMIIIITSNKHPDNLYQDGLQRDKFLEFTSIIKTKLNLFLLNYDTDYRLNKLGSKQQVFFTPNNTDNNKKIEYLFHNLRDHHPPTQHIIYLKGRELVCKNSYKNIGKFSFNELCKENLGPADYIALCKYFRVILLSDIPKLSAENNNELVRFINLIDEIYEHNILLICSSETEFNQIYIKGRLTSQFERTLSRLNEMQSEEYINKSKIHHE